MKEAAPGAPTPSANPRLAGHADAERRLLEAYRSGRLPHAWLFSGPRGIGKATLAYRFARYLLAGGGEGGSLFGLDESNLEVAEEDPTFRKIAHGAHPNLAVLERRRDEKGKLQKVISVADVRSVGGFLRLTAAGDGWRIVIVDAADDLNLNAANALLKMLEEPPARALLLLVTHAEGRLLATLRSRCCRLPLTPLGAAELEAVIAPWLPEDLGDEDRRIITRLAEGAPGRALALAGEGAAGLYRRVLEALEALAAGDTAALHDFAEALAAGRDGTAFRTGSELLRWWGRAPGDRGGARPPAGGGDPGRRARAGRAAAGLAPGHRLAGLLAGPG